MSSQDDRNYKSTTDMQIEPQTDAIKGCKMSPTWRKKRLQTTDGADGGLLVQSEGLPHRLGSFDASVPGGQ